MKTIDEWPMVSLGLIRQTLKIAPTDKKGNGKVIQEAKGQAKKCFEPYLFCVKCHKY